MEKKKTFKWLSFVFALVILLSIGLVGCSSSESTTGKSGESNTGSESSTNSETNSGSDNVGSATKEISFVAAQYSNATKPFLEKVVKDFESENPDIKVNLKVIGWDVLEQQVNTMIATKQTPDILNLNHYAAFASDDLLMPLEEVISPELKGKFYDSFYDAGKVDGTAYGLPFLASIRGLFYNKDLFEQAGISEPPKTWDELVNVAKQIKDKTGVDGFGLPMTNLEGQAYFSYFSWGNGGDWKKDGEWVLNSPENVEAVQFMSDLVNKHKVTNPQPTAINRDEMHKVFGSGRIGMMISANFLPTILKSESPDLNYDVAPIPVNEGKDPINLGVEDFLMVFKSTKNPDAVSEFLDFFYQDERYQEFMTNEGMLPATKAVGVAMSKADPFTAKFIDQLPIAKFYPLTDPRFPQLRTEQINAVQKVLLGEASAQEALDALQKIAEN
jgi:multiple sugar transport system substrate-binding protein